MKLKFWGVRGSTPCPGPNTVKYGGNTSCIEIRLKDTDRLIVVDAGSGIRDLGNYMMGHDLPKGPMSVDIFLTHTHWDHIMGYPFFTPIYIPGTQIRVHGPVSFEKDTLQEIVGGQLTYRYFPVRQTELASKREYISFQEGRFDFGDGLIVKTKYLNHPVLTLGYRFEYNGKAIVTAYDTEPYRNLFCTDPEDPSYDELMASEGDAIALEQNQMLDDFCRGADLIVYDAQYIEEEMSAKLGWGHSTVEYAIDVCKRLEVPKMALFHHEPIRTDAQIDELAETFCTPDKTGGADVFFAREGVEIEI